MNTDLDINYRQNITVLHSQVLVEMIDYKMSTLISLHLVRSGLPLLTIEIDSPGIMVRIDLSFPVWSSCKRADLRTLIELTLHRQSLYCINNLGWRRL